MDEPFILLGIVFGFRFRRTVYHRFLTAHDVLPGSFCAMNVQCKLLLTRSWMIISSSHGSKGDLLTSGWSLNCHRSRHCLADRPGILLDSSSQHMWPENDAIASSRSLSSWYVHGPLPPLGLAAGSPQNPNRALSLISLNIARADLGSGRSVIGGRRVYASLMRKLIWSYWGGRCFESLTISVLSLKGTGYSKPLEQVTWYLQVTFIEDWI